MRQLDATGERQSHGRDDHRSVGGLAMLLFVMASATLRRQLRARYHTPYGICERMSHVRRDRDKLLNRIRRIRGQLNAVEKAIEEEQACAAVLQTLVACRGAMNGLVAVLLEDHVRRHIVDPDKSPSSKRAEGARELINVLRTYLT